MATCKRCGGAKVGWPSFEAWRTMKPRDFQCPDCKGTGEVEDVDSEREGDNTSKGDGDA